MPAGRRWRTERRICAPEDRSDMSVEHLPRLRRPRRSSRVKPAQRHDSGLHLHDLAHEIPCFGDRALQVVVKVIEATTNIDQELGVTHSPLHGDTDTERKASTARYDVVGGFDQSE